MDFSTIWQVPALLQVEMASDSGDEEFFDAEERELASVSSRRSLSSQLSSRSNYYEASSEPSSPSVVICIISGIQPKTLVAELHSAEVYKHAQY